MSTSAQNASAFISTLGVNTHLGWAGTAYANLPQVLSAASYLGLHNFRDTMDSAPAVNQAAAAGIRFDIFVYPRQTGAFSQIDSLVAAHPGSVIAIEGPNEVDGSPVSYAGLSGYAAARAFQQALYGWAHSDPNLAGVPVYNLTVSGVDASKYQSVGDLSAYADYGNVHIYYNGGEPMWGWSPQDPTFFWTSWLKAGQQDALGRPTLVTEVGNSTYGGGVSEAVQAKQALNAVMDAADSGTAATFFYELADSRSDPSGTDQEAHFGLFRANWTPKPAATALHNLTTILTAHSTGAAFATGGLDFSIKGLPAQSGAHLFQQQDGTLDLVVWAEPDIWNENTGAPIAAPTSTVTITLANALGAAVYDPLQGTSPIRSLGTTSQIAVDVTDHPIIIELTGSSAPGAVAPPPSTPSIPATLPGAIQYIGGASDDVLTGPDGQASYLRGGAGADSITGGSGFNDINGNQGNDTIVGRSQVGDWLVGGQGDDVISAQSSAHNLLFGNLGNDTLAAGAGGDTLRGGQGDDSIVGGAGADWISGDRGSDTVSGGGGADTFHSASGMGVTTVTDFHRSEGDHVLLDPGTQSTTSQVGADVHVDIVGGGELILKNVQLTSLTSGWLVSA